MVDTAAARAGDVVATDADGRAELVYPDGSLTRLGPDTRLVIEEVSTAEEQRTVVTLDVGQTWHRVVELVAEDAAYEVQTPVGTAAVTGTEFSVECTDEPVCRIVVFEGSVLFTLDGGEEYSLEPYQQLTVPAPEDGEPEVLPFIASAVGGDEWFAANFDPAAAADPPAASAALAGEWTVSFLGLSTTDPRRASMVGTTIEREWSIGEPECDPVCVSTVESSSGSSVGLEYGASAPAIPTRAGTAECVADNTGEVLDPDGFDVLIEYAFSPAELGPRGAVTTLTGTRTDTYTLRADADPTCSSTVTQTVVVDTWEVTAERAG